MPKKKEKPTPEYDSERETRVLLEEMHKSIKTVGEGHAVLDKKLDNVTSELTSVKSELNSVKMAVMDNNNRIKKLEVGQAKLEVGQERIEHRLENVEQKLDTAISDHEQRIERLETLR